MGQFWRVINFERCHGSVFVLRQGSTDVRNVRYGQVRATVRGSLSIKISLQFSSRSIQYILLYVYQTYKFLSDFFLKNIFWFFVKIAFLMWSLVGQKFDWKRWSVFGEREMKRPRLSSENDSLLIISKENLSFRPLWETKNYERSFWVNSEGLRSLPVVNQKVFCKNQRP